MAMTDGSVMPSSRAQGTKALLYPALLPGLLPTLQKPGQEGKSKNVNLSVSPALILACLLKVMVAHVCFCWLYSGKWLAKKQHRWLQMAIS